MRGISTVIATILLLVMIVVITAGVFYFFRGTLTTATTKGQESLTGAITETEVQAKVKISNYAIVTAQGINGSTKDVIRLTVVNSLQDKDVTVKRIDIPDLNYINPTIINCSNYTTGLGSVDVPAGSYKDICINETTTVDNLKNKKVILYVTIDNKAYTLTEYLS